MRFHGQINALLRGRNVQCIQTSHALPAAFRSSQSRETEYKKETRPNTLGDTAD